MTQNVPHTRRSTETLSRFMKRTLLPDEAVIAEGKFHGFYTFYGFLVFALCVVIGAGLKKLAYHYTGELHWGPVLALAGIGLWVLFWRMMKRLTTEIVLTDQRLIYKRGFFKINVNEVDIEQLASDSVEQSLMGRILNYGAVHLTCVQAEDIYLPDIKAPYDFRNKVLHQKHAYREHYMNVDRLYKHGKES
jgi:hypothetical protein